MSKRGYTALRSLHVRRYCSKSEVQMIHDAGHLANRLLAIDEARLRRFGRRLLSPGLRQAVTLLVVEP